MVEYWYLNEKCDMLIKDYEVIIDCKDVEIVELNKVNVVYVDVIMVLIVCVIVVEEWVNEFEVKYELKFVCFVCVICKGEYDNDLLMDIC